MDLAAITGETLEPGRLGAPVRLSAERQAAPGLAALESDAVKNVVLFHQFPDGDLQNAGGLIETQRLILSRPAGAPLWASSDSR